jgi:esterase/lipase superfamily enzyme
MVQAGKLFVVRRSWFAPRSIFCVLLAALTAACHAAPSEAWIDEVLVHMDGSTDPPGDVVAFRVQIRGETQTAAVELRAYDVDAQGGSRSISSSAETLHDEANRFLIRKTLTADEAAGIADIRLTIPYSALELSAGEHHLGYEVRVLLGEALLVASASELTSVTISQNARTQQHQIDIRQRVVETSQPQSFMLGDQSIGRGPSKQTMEIKRPVMRVETAERDVSVRIPGGYARKSLLTLPTDQRDLRGQGREVLPHVQLSSLLPAANRTVQFCTNRQATTSPDGPPQFTALWGPQLTYGRAVVDVPVRYHRRGNLEQASWWGSSKETVFTINSLSVVPFENLHRALAADDVLVFVHGYNNPFEDVLLLTGQLTYDLGFGGKVILFSWPSAGSLTGYDTDAEMSAKSISAFAELLRNLLAAQAADAAMPKGRIHLLAHSMGNRVLLGAMNELFADTPTKADSPPFGQIVMAAPDVGAAQFNNQIDCVIRNCEQASYYFCRQDAALKVSQNVNKYEPVGLYPYFQSGLVTISADNANSSFLGHSYFAGSVEMLSDIGLLIQGARPDARKPPLVGRERVFGHDYWVFPPRAEISRATTSR